MKITQTIHVPTGEIFTGTSKDGRPIEFLTVADYGKNANIKADFLGITRELNGVPNGTPMSLSEKWVVTISTQHGCSMGCRFCDVPKVGPGMNIDLDELRAQVIYAITQHPGMGHTKRLNVHYARMGEPTFNRDVLRHAYNYLREDVRLFLEADTVHPVVSTMLPKNNRDLCGFLRDWCELVKNGEYHGEAGLQFSINSTDDRQRDWMFSGNTLSLTEIAGIADMLPMPQGRKYALNFALADNSTIDGKKLARLFDVNKFMCKITPLHKTASATNNNIATTGGYESFVPYRATEANLKENGFDVIVFVPSQDEENGMITCGNAVLSGRYPTTHPFPAIPPGTRKPNNKGKTTMSKKKTNPLDHVFGGTEYLKAKFDDIDEAVVSKKSKQAKDVKALVKRLATDKDMMYAYAVIKTAGKADGKPVSGYVVHVAMGLNGPGMGSDYAAALKRLLDTGKFCLLDAWIDAVDDLWDFILSVK